MSFPKTLLFTATPPGQGSVGENYLREVVKAMPQDKVCCYAPWSPQYAVWVASPELSWLPLEFSDLPPERLVGRRRGPVLDQVHSFLKRGKHWRSLDNIVEETIEYGQAHQVKVVFSVLSSPSIIHMTRAVVEGLNARLVTLILEPPQTRMRLLGFDPFSMAAVMRDFEHLIKSSERCVVASEGLKEDFFLDFDLPSSVLTRPIDPAHRQPFKQPDNGNKFVIGFAGSIYAADEFRALLSALAELGWQLDGKDIVMKVMGNSFNLPLYVAGKRARLEFLGHRSLEESIGILSECDVAYAPYWFDPKFARSARTCFPDKLVSYITAGVPVLYHGPEDSTPTRFIERYPIGISCHTMDTKKIAAALKSIAGDIEFRKKAYDAGERARKEELNPQVFRSRIYELLGVQNIDKVTL